MTDAYISSHSNYERRYKKTVVWFHPHENPLSEISDEQKQRIIADYHESLKLKSTEAGVWCESLAYYALGSKQ